ncbi:LysR substrate-binding domain-containing protein, partial [Rhizobium ruizarguesonis]
ESDLGAVDIPPIDQCAVSLVGRAFLRDRMVVVASPDLPRPTGGVAAPGVARGVGEARTWHVKTAGGRAKIRIEPVLTLSTLITIRDAVRAGVG